MAFTCVGVTKEYRTRRGAVAALSDVSITVDPGEFVCIVGPSGCGKTTLLKIVAGLVDPTSGGVRFEDASQSSPRATLVFQEHGIFEWMRVVDNVAFGLEARGVAGPERRRRANELIDRMGLEGFADAYPHELSVGMRQRVGIARAFLTGTTNLLMDEPFGSLDAQTKLVLQEDLLRLWEAERKSVLYVTHDIEEAVALADRVLVMSGRPGRIRRDIKIPFQRPRTVGPERGAEQLSIERDIWRLLKDDVLEEAHPRG